MLEQELKRLEGCGGLLKTLKHEEREELEAREDKTRTLS